MRLRADDQPAPGFAGCPAAGLPRFIADVARIIRADGATTTDRDGFRYKSGLPEVDRAVHSHTDHRRTPAPSVLKPVDPRFFCQASAYRFFRWRPPRLDEACWGGDLVLTVRPGQGQLSPSSRYKGKAARRSRPPCAMAKNSGELGEAVRVCGLLATHGPAPQVRGR